MARSLESLDLPFPGRRLRRQQRRHWRQIFDLPVNGEALLADKEPSSIPDIKELRQLVRDRIAPGKNLGHSDR